MLTQVDVRNVQGALMALPMGDVSSGIFLEEVEGLGPVKATLVSSSFANLDGEQYHSSRREARNLKLKIGLEPDYAVDTVEDLRQRLYDFFMTKSKVDLTFTMSSGLNVDITGRVESCEPDIFTSEPTMDVSLICHKPDFVDPDVVTISGNTVSDTTETPITYAGSVETGIKFVLSPNRAMTDFTIYHRPPDGSLRSLQFVGSLQAGDTLTINTVRGSKYVTLTRGGSNSPMLYAMDPTSSWIEFMRGINNIRVYAVGGAVPYSIEYTTKYGGL